MLNASKKHYRKRTVGNRPATAGGISDGQPSLWLRPAGAAAAPARRFFSRRASLRENRFGFFRKRSTIRRSAPHGKPFSHGFKLVLNAYEGSHLTHHSSLRTSFFSASSSWQAILFMSTFLSLIMVLTM